MRPVYRIGYHSTAFGDNLFSAAVVEILRQNGFEAYLDNKKIEHLVDCPIYDQRRMASRRVLSFNCVRRNRTGKDTEVEHTVFTDLLSQFRKAVGLKDEIITNIDSIPVRWEEKRYSDQCDVVLVTETGSWTPYRNWPNFEELKNLLRGHSISYIDASEERCRDNDLLNRVRQSRLYVGLETGASHYVSRFANGKALIIQSGYSDFRYWAGAYDFEPVSSRVECSPCWKREGCPGHACMNEIGAETVFELIVQRLGR